MISMTAKKKLQSSRRMALELVAILEEFGREEDQYLQAGLLVEYFQFSKTLYSYQETLVKAILDGELGPDTSKSNTETSGRSSHISRTTQTTSTSDGSCLTNSSPSLIREMERLLSDTSDA